VNGELFDEFEGKADVDHPIDEDFVEILPFYLLRPSYSVSEGVSFGRGGDGAHQTEVLASSIVSKTDVSI
jgi:hypothetical protein